MLKLNQFVRVARSYGFIKSLSDGTCEVEFLNGRIREFNPDKVHVLPGCENPISVDQLHKGDIVYYASISNDDRYGTRVTISTGTVGSVSIINGRKERFIGRASFELGRPVVKRFKGDNSIIAIFDPKLN